MFMQIRLHHKKLVIGFIIYNIHSGGIHPVGSEFPGNLKIEKRNGKFLCPVKDYQKDNEQMFCLQYFLISFQSFQ